MKLLLPGRILVVLLALIVGVALGAGLISTLRAPSPPDVEPIQLETDDGDEPGKGDKKKGNDNRDKRKDKGPRGNVAPPPQNDPPPAGGAPPPPPPPPPGDDDDDDDGGDDDDDDDDDGGGDD